MPLGAPPAPTTFRASVPWRIARLPGDEGRERHEIAGLVEAYVCENCGLTALYTQAPRSIPVDVRYVRRIESGTKGPYR